MRPIEITAYRCVKCGKIHYPYHDRCLCCKGRQFEEMKAEGNAKLLTYTQIFNLPWGFDQRFLILGVVEFENGVKAMGQIDAPSLDNLSMGMTLHPTWAPIRQQYGENVYGLKLELI